MVRLMFLCSSMVCGLWVVSGIMWILMCGVLCMMVCISEGSYSVVVVFIMVMWKVFWVCEMLKFFGVIIVFSLDSVWCMVGYSFLVCGVGLMLWVVWIIRLLLRVLCRWCSVLEIVGCVMVSKLVVCVRFCLVMMVLNMCNRFRFRVRKFIGWVFVVVRRGSMDVGDCW